MNELIKNIIYILVGVSILLAGMKMMSGGLKKSLGHGIRRFFKKTQNNPLVSMGIGTVVTAGIQSSDATNAMVIGFINAGAMTLFQGLCIMLGAYIGTTITGVIAAFSSLSISYYFLLFSVIGTAMMFIKNDKVKNIGEMLCGLGFLFFGLAIMKDAFGGEEGRIASAIKDVFSKINFGPLLFLFGVLITSLMQSSSAVTSIVISLVGSNALTLSCGLYIVLGATLGTVATTLLTSIGGNVQGKRAASIAFFLRAISSIIMLIILLPLESQISSLLGIFAIKSGEGINYELSVAMFTVLYNVIFMPLLLPLLKPCIKLFTKIVKDKDSNRLAKSVHFIDDKLLVNPIIASMQVKKEIINMYDLAYSSYQNSIKLLTNKDSSYCSEIEKYEEQIDYLNERITNFLISLSPKLDNANEKSVGSYFHVINDIERIGDHAYNFLTMFKDMENKDLSFSNDAMSDVQIMNEILEKMFILTREIFIDMDQQKLHELHSLEDKTDELKTKMSAEHYERIKANKCINELSPFYTSFVTEFERIADHLTNIGYSIRNPLGDDTIDEK